ncbi:DMSO/selenate family reductase complex A subunit [Shewanella sp. 6_MG-2023]|uniref:DMSO/selenate family reductase complex A subunit n=1 Tax=Shewanella sp. 6_MG-2023 TaxID=3062660 RepID=UPI0026E41AEA|nr:DMSO/selenate family reductase complex A subunit [Shewanella sp. 6_MG-2023]MDO6621116.1 molybdopterin-dependent oxidoreductase [Shewanella sp. 6_MG-2023]
MERRSFLKASAALGCAATVTGCKTSSDDANVKPPEPTSEVQSWSACLGNCGSNCPLKIYSRDGVITRIETDEEGSGEYRDHHVIPCARGRGNRKRIYNADRLQYPLKRTGKRGEGKFERISWEQAINEIGTSLNSIYDNYGPRSVFWVDGSGADYSLNGVDCWQRLLNTKGGFLAGYGSYSSAQAETIFPLVVDGYGGSKVLEMQHSDFHLFFGYNLAEIRQSGSGEAYEYQLFKEKNGAKAIHIDCRYNDTVLGKGDEFHPCRPGTDAALVSGIAYHLIVNNLIDEEYLNKFCYGFRNEAALPEKGLDALPYERSYEAYILGAGELDSQPKTPEWAERICGVPAVTIKSIAEQLAAAKAPFVASGHSIQRHANGEYNVWSMAALAALVGAIGKRGTSNGMLPFSFWGFNVSGMPGVDTGTQKAVIPNWLWPLAVEDGENLDVHQNGVVLPADELGEDGNGKLGANIKFALLYAGNTLINQHGDCNGTAKILEQEDLCETIVVIDNHMTASAKYADYVLPDKSWLESTDIADQSYSAGGMSYLTALTTNVKPLGECKSSYEMCSMLSEVLGTSAQFTEGRTEGEWLEYMYTSQIQPNYPEDLPATLEEFQEKGLVKKYTENDERQCALYDYVNNGATIGTVSGKIELFSHAVDRIGKNRVAPSYIPDHFIVPIPAYVKTWEGYEDNSEAVKDYPLQLIGHHTKGRVHSSHASNPWLNEAVFDAVWVNPKDALGYSDGDDVIVESLRGKVLVKARITNRVMPGVASLPQGQWYNPQNGIDIGGCINTLTSQRPCSISNGNPQHTVRAKVYKA